MCDARIRPFPNPTELVCDRIDEHDRHSALLRDYAYPGSESVVTWHETDRRTFRGEWQPCDRRGCILPLRHRGDHAN